MTLGSATSRTHYFLRQRSGVRALPSHRALGPSPGWLWEGTGAPVYHDNYTVLLQESSPGGWMRPWPSWRQCCICTGVASTYRTPQAAAQVSDRLGDPGVSDIHPLGYGLPLRRLLSAKTTLGAHLGVT